MSRKDRGVRCDPVEGCDLKRAVVFEHVKVVWAQIFDLKRTSPEHVDARDFVFKPRDRTNHISEFRVAIQCLASKAWRRAPNSGGPTFSADHGNSVCWFSGLFLVKEKARVALEDNAQRVRVAPGPWHLTGKKVEATLPPNLAGRRKSIRPFEQMSRIAALVEQTSQPYCRSAAVYLFNVQWTPPPCIPDQVHAAWPSTLGNVMLRKKYKFFYCPPCLGYCSAKQ